MKNYRRRSLLAIVLVSCSAAVLGRFPQHASTEPVTVFFVRHAEKNSSDPTDHDPSLTADGERRAQVLAKLLSKTGASHLYSSPLRRTRSTLAPLAKLLGLEVEAIPPQEQARQVEELRLLPPGSVAVVAGHSNTVPAMVAALGGAITDLTDHPRFGKLLGDDEYDRLFIVTLPKLDGAPVQTIELRYGD